MVIVGVGPISRGSHAKKTLQSPFQVPAVMSAAAVPRGPYQAAETEILLRISFGKLPLFLMKIGIEIITKWSLFMASDPALHPLTASSLCHKSTGHGMTWTVVHD